jgi:hypothetical protein
MVKKMVIGDILSAIQIALDLYGKYSTNKEIEHKQQMLEITLIKMHYFGQQPGIKGQMTYGIYATTENELNSVHELSKMDRFNAIEDAMSRGLITDSPTTINQNEWALTRKGMMYVDALLEEINKK